MQLSSDAAVKKILAGERADAKGKPPSSKSRDKESRGSKPEEQKRHKDKEVGICNFCGVQGLLLFMVYFFVVLFGWFFWLAFFTVESNYVIRFAMYWN